ncbi:hypothetical protein [Arthrobacter oryzae]|uniref:Uncharacterized protein n=1 Tax=Arthrobacter oryzae TaxID=409290 RepID=A0A3N0C8F4_9MICC|nr:hypothetical protein [Arthrobacter oryzae]RNL59194.1 hypothetical protein D7003_02745 [Arthrobacter oryzae]
MVHPDDSASTHAPPGVGARSAPGQAWILAPLIAGQPVYRPGRWVGGRFQYPRPQHPPRITGALPAGPAAVLIHGVDGSVATLCLDLDTSKALKGVVDADAAALGRLLDSSGLRYVADVSPSGGRHLYVPLAERMTGPEARELVEAMTLMAPSLDPGPHQNVTDGCIRVPGSLHKSGGHQILTTHLSAAYDILRRRNPPAAVQALRRALAPELRRARELKNRQAKAAAAAAAATRGPGSDAVVPGGSQSPLRVLARTGLYDTARYASPSEARMAVLNHFAACGWTLEQVRGELTGQFPGLAALYAGTGRQERLLDAEWAKACAFTQKPGTPERGGKSARINNTSQPLLTGGQAEPTSRAGVHQLVNDLENVLYAVLDHRLKERGREGVSLRLLLRAVLGYLRTMETDTLDVGCRTFAAALGKHHVTIARLLPVLASASDGILSKVGEARGRHADTYLIQLPAHFEQLARDLSWRRGKIHGIRPVFRALGDVAALVYEAIERGRLSPTTAAIVRATGLSRTAVDTALATMSSYTMIERRHGHWAITAGTGLTDLARRLGALDDAAEQISRHRKQRAAWHAWLDRHLTPELAAHEIDDPEADLYWIPPSDTELHVGGTLWRVA